MASRVIYITVTVLLIAGLAVSLFMYFQQTGKLQTAEAEIVDLKADVSSLENTLAVRQTEIENLEEDLSEAEGEVTSLESEVVSLEARLADKNAEITGLENDLRDAQAEVGRLESEIESAEGDIQTLEAELVTAQDQVDSINQALAQARDERGALQAQLADWGNGYASLIDQIDQKFGLGDDASSFLTPEDPAVVNLAAAITGGLSEDWDEHWADILDLYLWVVNNIEYAIDTPLPVLPETPDGSLGWFDEYWRMPVETIVSESGDCEDMSVLLASLVMAYEQQQFPTWGIGLMSDNGGHLAVALPAAGTNLVILDPAGNFYTGGGGDVDTSLTGAEAINEWLQYWSFDMPNVYVDFIFGDSFAEYFNSTAEFLSWFTG